MYNSAYVLGFDPYVSRHIQSYIVHPFTEARTSHYFGILRFQCNQNSRFRVKINREIASLVDRRDWDSNTESAMEYNEDISDLWYKKVELNYHLEKLNLGALSMELSSDILYFINPCAAALRETPFPWRLRMGRENTSAIGQRI